MKSKSSVLTILAIVVVALTTFFIQSHTAVAEQFASMNFGSDGTGAYIEPLTGLGIRLNANRNTYGVVVRDNGNMGIGTAKPSAKLHVNGAVRALAFKTGDIIFRLGDEEAWRMYEKTDGLYLQSIKTGESSKIFLEKDITPLKDELKVFRSEIKQIKERIKQ